MIIFDLDGTLADCEHRRHFVDPRIDPNAKFMFDDLDDSGQSMNISGNWYQKRTENRWKPDWQSFYEACDKDKPINPSLKIITEFLMADGMDERFNIQIWSGRCESVRGKTLDWLERNIDIYGHDAYFFNSILKMCPIGDNTPDDQLKERWLDERCSYLMEARIEGRMPVKHDINFVFDACPKSIAMWRRRGIFVFDCNQTGKEF